MALARDLPLIYWFRILHLAIARYRCVDQVQLGERVVSGGLPLDILRILVHLVGVLLSQRLGGRRVLGQS